MPSNHARIDVDLVQKTQYKIPPNKTAKKTPQKPWPLPELCIPEHGYRILPI
ncbi:uncharacterized protein K441DRAFT_652445 [Cenococcum geophilum 1.58]|uniref:uncharacterized protein n=1 Tax=Cenococcum geophilum 1.58 TaxID=794803 RepID=UPI00358EAF01|nr:hypothetical protein K441DRAFT_652445 [Cenococcum geophilum 1.58]